ncbi:hypothetical protein CVT26_010660 [Gymnopilus dilepis]|uniref:Uncharacterized protein n=1 Tax=Gymnopilus dilepis TaxID=231916 RepID=A0A409VIC1_9AGAR|nr:hypothetical protein CVT26_010660 [Gymnopilus dilepis]
MLDMWKIFESGHFEPRPVEPPRYSRELQLPRRTICWGEVAERLSPVQISASGRRPGSQAKDGNSRVESNVTKIRCPPSPTANSSFVPIMSYQIFGKAVKNEYLALGTFGLTFGSAWLATRGGNKATAQAKPQTVEQAKESVPINAGSSILNFIKEAEKEGAGASSGGH